MLEQVEDPEVREAFMTFPARLRERLLALRALVMEAAADAEVEVVETLKWGQPSYLPRKPRVGSTLRLGQVGEDAALFFHCQTTLVEEFRATFGDRLRYQRNRAVLFGPGDVLAPAVIKHCASASLRYHIRRRTA